MASGTVAQPMGEIVNSISSGSVSLVSATSLSNVASFSLPSKGTWIISVAVAFGNNSSGYRFIALSTESTGDLGIVYTTALPAANGRNTTLNMTCFHHVDSATTLYLNACQNSGSTLTASPRVRICKVGG